MHNVGISKPIDDQLSVNRAMEQVRKAMDVDNDNVGTRVTKAISNDGVTIGEKFIPQSLVENVGFHHICPQNVHHFSDVSQIQTPVSCLSNGGIQPSFNHHHNTTNHPSQNTALPSGFLALESCPKGKSNMSTLCTDAVTVQTVRAKFTHFLEQENGGFRVQNHSENFPTVSSQIHSLLPSGYSTNPALQLSTKGQSVAFSVAEFSVTPATASQPASTAPNAKMGQQKQ
ncbi:hypothetical protein LguiB_022721 [Lonicera macranthoides]